jgi:hypothetical protein
MVEFAMRSSSGLNTVTGCISNKRGAAGGIWERYAATTAQWGENGQSGVGCNPEARLQGDDVEGSGVRGTGLCRCSPDGRERDSGEARRRRDGAGAAAGAGMAAGEGS